MSAKLPTATPRDGSPFSNGTEGYAWMANWCDRCIHDKPARQDRYEDACQIVVLALCGQTPGEWLEQRDPETGLRPLGDAYHCIEFRDEGDGPPPPTEPEPTPPGQGELFPMEDYVGTRMFADVVAEAKAVETCP
ncbi:hypothetical protein [Nocardioides sp. YIM 152315]|uniref:hypothetical protein n=1 Tax=Nocardioides sp. YIM 152315 TaxID=3031760 RepID=UPI0023DC9C7A|nr:hypothetical protein [Nocardioides sp. YIM 152315]MDF1603376.1 hypothetical protein [Nocardioides sp. YIM 152315]